MERVRSLLVSKHRVFRAVFCPGDCPFESDPSPTSADACGEVTGCNAGHQEVGRCSTRC